MKYGRLLVALVGLTCVRLALTGQYKQYVRVGMGRYLALAGIALGLLALADIFLHRSDETLNNEFEGDEGHPPHEHDHDHDHEHEHEHEQGHEHGHGHDHGSTPKIAWLLLLPIAVAFAVVPPALGKWGIDRSSNAAIVATRNSNYLPLKPSSTPLQSSVWPPQTQFASSAMGGEDGSVVSPRWTGKSTQRLDHTAPR